MKKRSRFFFIIGTVAVLSGLALVFLPWKGWIAGRLQVMLEGKGFEQVRLTLSGLNFRSATLRDITIGTDKPLVLKNLTLLYSPADLWRKNLRELTVSGLALDLRQQKGAWALQGFRAPAKDQSPVAVPVTPEQIAAVPFTHLKLDDSLLNIIAERWQVTLPLQMEWHKAPVPEILMTTEKLRFASRSLKANAAEGNLRMRLSEGREWRGDWQIKDIEIESGYAGFPAMAGAGAVNATADTLSVAGEIKSEDKLYYADFRLAYPLAGPGAALTLIDAAMPWKGGKLSTKNARIPLGSSQPVALTLRAEGVSVNEMMQALTGKRVSATGSVSGTVPLLITRDGMVSFGQGDLRADGPGVITMPPEAIPGDSEQVALTREILKNFHYDGLAISVSSDPEGRLALLLALEGNNPDVYSGKPVKLNVRLAGDVLDYIKQNVLILTRPETLLNQDRP